MSTAVRAPERVSRADFRDPRTVRKILSALEASYSDVKCFLAHETPLQLLVATILSAQCTDARVNRVTPALFREFRTARDFARAPLRRIERAIRSTGFYRSKARSIQGSCRQIIGQFGRQVPRTLEELVTLPGVGRKTANVVLGNAFGMPGITVDTHVGRISRLLRWTRHEDPVKAEFDLQKLWPRKDWTTISHRMIQHGRSVCIARRPACGRCPVARWCPSRQVVSRP